ncbi:MAG: YHYH protein [Bacteroidia bacterium]
MKKIMLVCFSIFAFTFAKAQVTDPEIISWLQNTTATGYGGYTSNVQLVQYSATQVYVSCSSIPEYSIGPWPTDPNVPSPQNFVDKFTRNPVQNTGTLVTTPMGNIGLWSNGVAIFNQKDGYYWNNATSSFTGPGTGTWNRNALIYEGGSFDACLGHPAPGGCYHNHVNPKCLYDATDSTHHSPIIGYAFDGFPIYGAYGYTSTTGTGPIKRMKSSYVLSTATTRALGPPVNATYPLGNMCEDYVYTAGAGDLDIHNGRFCVTPEFPAGMYCYFVTIDANLNPVYPFVIGNTYYGTVQSGNTGPSGGHVTISESTTTYTPTTAGISDLPNTTIKCQIVPNPVADDHAYIYMDASSMNNVKGNLFNSKGQLVKTIEIMQPSIAYTLDMTGLPAGIYMFSMESGDKRVMQKIVKTK